MKKFYFLALIAFLAGACAKNGQTGPSGEQSAISDSIRILTSPDQNAEAVFLYNNGKDIIINWTQQDEHDRKNNLLRYAFFDYKTHAFDSIRTVPASRGLQLHVESMAKMAMDKAGKLWAVYRKKSPNDRSRFGGHLYYVISNDSGRTWSDEYKLVKDTTSTSQSFYDVALLPNGRIGLTWLDSRSKRRGKTLYLAQTDSAGLFSIQKPVAFSTCECCRTELYVDPRGRIHIAYRNLIEPDEEGFDGKGDVEIRDMYYLYSKDTAKTFTKPVPISRDNWHIYGCPHTGPSLAWNGKALGAVWFTAAHNQPGIFFTTGHDGQFNPRTLLSKEGRHPQMIALGGKYYAVYEEYYEKDGKGYYRIVLDVMDGEGHRKRYEISAPLTKNDHAVLTPVDDKHILVAWVNTDTRHPKIEYRMLPVDDLSKWALDEKNF